MPATIASFTTYLEVECDRSPRTIESYRDVLEDFSQFLEQEFGAGSSALIEIVDFLQVARFMRSPTRRDRPVTDGIWNIRLSALRTFFNYLKKKKVITVNPAEDVKAKKMIGSGRMPLNLDQMVALVEGAELAAGRSYRERNVAILTVFCHCGLRVQELAALNVEHVDLQNHEFKNIRVKGRKTVSVLFSDLVGDSLEKYLAVRKAPVDERALFVTNRGSRIAVRTLQEFVKTYALKAGIIVKTTPHVLRHSGATEHAENGVPMPVIQTFLNHASAQTTDRYVHISEAPARKAIAAQGARWRARATALKKRTKGATKKSASFVH